ncbi:apolipoprotein L3-like, partial [Mus pahari]|uniref:apolipoprotein L3-like n=1 Tax=Mus pahari TaxID=10093 RepID=UPI000A304839
GSHIAHKVFDNLTEALSKTDLRSLITEDGAWKGFVKAAELSREEEAALRDALKKYFTQKPSGENDGPQREQQKEQFLREFPQLKKKLEDHIRKLRELADHFDQVHKRHTKYNTMSSVLSVSSGVLELSGLALAPFTAGTSLAFSAASTALGATSSVSSFVTTIVENSNRVPDECKARYLIGDSEILLKDILKIMPNILFKLGTACKELVEDFKKLKDQIRAIRTVRSISRIGAEAKNLASTGRSSVQGVLPVARGARIRAAGLAGVFLAWDLYDLVNQPKDGGETESAKALRDLARKLEENLQKFEQMYKDLQSDLP